MASELHDVVEVEHHGTRTWAVAGKGFAWERPFSKADIRRFGDETPPEGPILAVKVEDLGEKEAVLAAQRSVVTVEEVVDSLAGAPTNACILPHWAVGAIVIAPHGAFPSYAYGYYQRNNAFYIEWDAISRDRDGFQRWIDQNVMHA